MKRLSPIRPPTLARFTSAFPGGGVVGVADAISLVRFANLSSSTFFLVSEKSF